MTADDSNKVVPLSQQQRFSDNGSGNGGGRSIGERLSAIEAHMQHMATKAWVLAGVVGGMGLAATITIAVIRLFAATDSG